MLCVIGDNWNKMLHLKLVFFVCSILVLDAFTSYSQTKDLEKLLQKYAAAKPYSSEKLQAINKITAYYLEIDNFEEVRFYTDEAFQIIQNLKDFEGVQNTYMARALLNLYTGYLDESIPDFKEAVFYAKLNKDHRTRTNAYAGLSEVYSRYLNHDLASRYIDTTLVLSKEYNFTDIQASALNCKAYLADHLGNKQEALEIFTELGKLYEKDEDRELAVIYNNIGELHRKMGNFEMAKSFYYKAVVINQSRKSVDALIMNYSNLGVVLLEQDSIDKGKEYYFKAIDLCAKSENIFLSAKAYHDMAILYVIEKDYIEAKKNLDLSMKLCQDQNYVYGIVMNQIKEAEILVATARKEEALPLVLKAITGADTLQMHEDRLILYRMIYELYKANGFNREALFYLDKAYQLDDSLKLDEKNRIIINLQNNYEREKSDQEIFKLQELVLERDFNLKFFVILFLIFIIIALSYLAILYFKKRQNRHANDKLLAENNLLKKELTYKNQELSDLAHFLSEQYQHTLYITKQSNSLFANAPSEFKKKLFSIQKDFAQDLSSGIWKEFETGFDSVNRSFFENLLKQFPDLSPNELKICSYLKLNLSTREIAGLLNRSVGTIANARSVLRKKMKVEDDISLWKILINI